MKTKTVILALSAVLLTGFATVGEAKRFGGGKSYRSYSAPAKKADAKRDEPAAADDSPLANIRLPVSGRGASTSGTVTSAGAGAAGAAAGADAAEEEPSPEDLKRMAEQRALEEQIVKRLAEERKAREAAEEARKKEEQERLAAIAAAERAEKEKREQADADRRARIENDKEIERQRQARLNACVVKPVMTDAEIETCKEIWR